MQKKILHIIWASGHFYQIIRFFPVFYTFIAFSALFTEVQYYNVGVLYIYNLWHTDNLLLLIGLFIAFHFFYCISVYCFCYIDLSIYPSIHTHPYMHYIILAFYIHNIISYISIIHIQHIPHSCLLFKTLFIYIYIYIHTYTYIYIYIYIFIYLF